MKNIFQPQITILLLPKTLREQISQLVLSRNMLSLDQPEQSSLSQNDNQCQYAFSFMEYGTTSYLYCFLAITMKRYRQGRLSPSSLNNRVSQVISVTTEAILLNSASAELLAIVSCSLVFQDIKAHPNFTKYHITDFLVWRQHPSLNHKKNLMWLYVNSLMASASLSPGALLIDLTTLNVALSECLGLCMNWLRTCTTNAISILIIVRYSNLPTSLWYFPTFSNTGSSSG